MSSHALRLVPIAWAALLAGGCAAPGSGGLRGKWQVRTEYGYYSDLLQIRSSPSGTINPAYLAVYKKRWVLLRTKRRYLARTFAAETRGTSTNGTVLLTDLQSGKRYAGRYARRGEWLHLYFVPGIIPPPRLLRRSRIQGAAYARLRWDGRAPGRHRPRCPARPTPKIAFDTPSATFNTLLYALARNDASLLARCFAHPIPSERAPKLLRTVRKHLWRSCFLRQRPGRQYLRFWYLVTDPRDHKRTWQDRGRMRKIGPHWKIHKL